MKEYTFKHSARSYYDIYTPLAQAYPAAPTWLFKEMAGLFDYQSELMNRIALDILYPSTRESAYAFAARCDYNPSEAGGSSTDLTVTLSSAMAYTIYAGHKFSGVSLSTGLYVMFEATADASSGGTDTITVPVIQKEQKETIELSPISETIEFMNIAVPYFPYILKDTFILKVADIEWTRVDNFDLSDATDTHYVLLYQSSGKVRVLFGNGTTGIIPTLNSSVTAKFAITNGLSGTLSIGEIDHDEDSDSLITEVTNAVEATGGIDPESVSSIIRGSRQNARLRDAVWSKEDVEIASLKSMPSIIKAWAIPGIGEASVQLIPNGGGDPSMYIPDVEADVQALTVFGSMPITGLIPNYVITNISVTVTTRTGFDPVTVQNGVAFAMSLISSSFDIQILESYIDNGINTCREESINVFYGYGFVEADNNMLEYIINQWNSLLGTKEYRSWGDPLEVGDIWIMGNSLYDYGADVFNVISPTVNTITASDEIINTGTVTVA